MDLRKSLSKPFKKLKHRLAEGRRKRDRGSEGEDDREGREADARASETSQRSSHLHPEVEDAVESGPSRERDSVKGEEVGQVNPPISTPSILHHGEPGDTTLSVFSLLANTDDPPTLDPVQEPAESSTHALDPCVASEDTPNRKSTVPATAKSILLGVGESSGAYPPLKSAARYLCIILDNYEVRFSSHTFSPKYSQLHQQTKVNKQSIELLAPRIKALSESLCAPIPSGDVNERAREKKMER